MSQTFEQPPIVGRVSFARTRPLIASARRTWWIFLLQGIVTLALGLTAIVWPAAFITVFTVFVGANLVLLGVAGIAMAVRMRRS